MSSAYGMQITSRHCAVQVLVVEGDCIVQEKLEEVESSARLAVEHEGTITELHKQLLT